MHRKALQLGRLEGRVLARLWDHGPADVRRMHEAVGAPRRITPNTVQSALERLFRKGLAERCKRGRAYVYRARVSRREFVRRTLEALLDEPPTGDARLLLAGFVDLAERAGPEQLDELERLVRARRRAREEPKE